MNRRDMLLRSSFAFGTVSMQSLVTGLPTSFLMGLSQNAMAAEPQDYKYLVMSHMQSGDPVNTNVPGTYPAIDQNEDDPLSLIDHPKVDQLGDRAAGFETPIEFNLGDQMVKAAQPWSTLTDDLRKRFAFWHHGTFVNAHPDFPSVRRLNGAAKAENGREVDEYNELICQETKLGLGTLTGQPISVGGTRVSADDVEIPILKPTDIRDLFQSQISDLDKMIKLRSRYLDRAYAQVKSNGSPAQLKFLEQYAKSQADANEIGDSLGGLITGINGTDSINQAKMVVALLQINISPVLTMGIGFGGDNHADANLTDELTATVSAIPAINTLWEELKKARYQDRVVFASLNPFGRDLIRNDVGGRDHNGGHHAMFTFGPSIKGGVVGALEPTVYKGEIVNFHAKGIHSESGLSDGQLDIQASETLVSVGKTLAKAVGISDERINERLDGGKIIRGALT